MEDTGKLNVRMGFNEEKARFCWQTDEEEPSYFSTRNFDTFKTSLRTIVRADPYNLRNMGTDYPEPTKVLDSKYSNLIENELRRPTFYVWSALDAGEKPRIASLSRKLYLDFPAYMKTHSTTKVYKIKDLANLLINLGCKRSDVFFDPIGKQENPLPLNYKHYIEKALDNPEDFYNPFFLS